ncbi:MAG: polysaccharide biosynthesis/export family protein [Prevotella sp.]|jgi:polysaccharide export outer membrane protein|nr:polysaccharide biosynthesis/export family protein [Prevotella sp.]
MKKIIKTLALATMIVMAMSACKGAKEVAYFQDVANKDTVLLTALAQTQRVQSGDKLLIVVHSRDPQLATLYNTPIIGTRVGMDNTGGRAQSTMAYTVDSNGQIDFPVLGKLTVAGLKREEVAEMVQARLISENLCNDAVVMVERDNAYVNILGEVAHPGRYALTKDNMTVLDGLGMAGDLAIQGKRVNVMLIRNGKGQANTYQINLNDLSKTVSSPAYYLQEGDVIYVEPNNYRKRQTTVNGNNMLSTGFWISVASLITSVVSLATR